ncbi:MAG: AAA family ATPase [Parcubacteria group bacterium]|nr:AAA family ATPase [Parcubacteria group bacterium]|tara:strand:+ start:5227 stop:5940 length:714 start_codon:yes stop_codon:yes gene_type:complete
MAINFTTTEKSYIMNGVKMLVYAPSGLGKTMLAATAPAPIIISAESGLLSLSPQNQMRVYGKQINIPVMEINNVQDIIDAYNWFLYDPHASQFQTICIDSITEIGEQVLANAKLQVKDPRQAYGELIEKMNDMLKLFRDLPGKHVYVSAKEEKNLDGATGAYLYGPSMPGSKMAQQLPYLFDEVFNLGVSKKDDKGNSFRYLRTAPDLQYTAKDRSGALDEIECPDLNHIINKIINK